MLLLGYSSVSEAQIEDGIARLAKALVAAETGNDGAVATAGQETAPADILTAPTACTHYAIPLEGPFAGRAAPAGASDSVASPSIHA